MQPIETEFEDGRFRYTQLERHGDVALYCQEHKESHAQRFEVIRIRIQREHTWPTGVTTPEKEAYPGAGTWGKMGWTFFKREEAEEKVAELLATQESTPDAKL